MDNLNFIAVSSPEVTGHWTTLPLVGKLGYGFPDTHRLPPTTSLVPARAYANGGNRPLSYFEWLMGELTAFHPWGRSLFFAFIGDSSVQDFPLLAWVGAWQARDAMLT